MKSGIPCPKCKAWRGEEVAPTSIWEHLVPKNTEVHEYECQGCGYLWITEREQVPTNTGRKQESE